MVRMRNQGELINLFDSFFFSPFSELLPLTSLELFAKDWLASNLEFFPSALADFVVALLTLFALLALLVALLSARSP